RRGDALQRHLARKFARLDDLGVAHLLANHAGSLQHLHVDFVGGQGLQVRQADFGVQVLAQRREAALGQATLQRHLAAFEANLVEAARTRLLALVATAGGFTQARADATADAALGVLAALGGLERIELNIRHRDSLGFRDGDEIIHLADHPAHLGRVDQNAAAVDAAQAQAADGIAVGLLGADHRAHEGNFDLLLSHDLPQNLFDGLAALGSHFRRSQGSAQAVERGTDHVVGVAGAEALGNHVTHAHHFEDGAHRAAGNHAGTFGSGRNQHGGSAMLANHRVIQRAILQGNLEHAATGLFHCLLNRHRHFASLALAHADTAIAVAHHGQRGEAHGATTLHHLADTVDCDHFLAQAVVVLFFRGAFALYFSHLTDPRLELQAGFTRGIGQRLHAAMVTKARAIESHLLDAGRLGLFGNALAHQRRSGSVVALAGLTSQLRTHFGFQRGSADQHAIAFRRNNVGVDVQVRAEDREAMNAQLGNLPTGRNRTTQTGNFFVHDSSLRAPLFLLGFFDDDALVRITHALALVGFGFAISADFSGHLTDDLLVGAFDDDFRLAR